MATSLANPITTVPIATTEQQDPLKNFRLCLRIGNGLMIASLVAFIAAILLGYQFNHLIPMQVEIAAHIASMILPGLFKIGYVLRCIGRKHLGKVV
ncbi:hypothetical protein [Planctobacterium marinum]|uniref:hypothetical protein n=1 Tax=Planctobacterium marinum TaxID=1631968 RepID=UPI001E2B30DF|nr:hypothetical protein [Planctobacterium marinum]MCC2606737.1 hypothetical protein [Planctobacterium marinum]